jgi:hypothetical protein
VCVERNFKSESERVGAGRQTQGEHVPSSAGWLAGSSSSPARRYAMRRPTVSRVREAVSERAPSAAHSPLFVDAV